jgi:hypothetical protein
MPANLLLTAVIKVDSNMATAIMAAPIKIGIDDPCRSGVPEEFPRYSYFLEGCNKIEWLHC